MTTSSSNRIGAGAEQQQQPQFQATVNQSTPFMDSIRANIQSNLASRNISVDMNLAGGPSPDLLASFSRSQWSQIGAMLKKLGSRVQGVQEAKVALQVTYGDMLSKSTSFADLYSQLQADYIPGLDTEAVPQTRVQLQDPMVVDALIRGVYQSTLKRDPNSQELAARRMEIDAVIKKGTTTTPIGKSKAISTPGFTQTGAEEMVKSKIESGDAAVQEDIAQVKSLEFADFIGKLGQ